MRIATMCHRQNMGDIIWLSWVPNKEKPSRIGHGSHCLLVTQAGMFQVHEAKERGELKRGHIDLELQAWLLKNRNAQQARACYIYPPIGSYTQLPSECDPAQFGGDKTRPSGFDSEENPCHGTREWSDPQRRDKAMLQWRPGWVKKPWIPFEPEEILHYTDQFSWKTFEDPGAAHTHEEWLEKPNPGKTQREKRMYRQFLLRMHKRNWTKDRTEAKCVVWGG